MTNKCKKFPTNRSYEHAFPSDIASAFAQAVTEDLTVSGIDMTKFVIDWVLEPGYPLLTVDVDVDSNTIRLRQVLLKFWPHIYFKSIDIFIAKTKPVLNLNYYKQRNFLKCE